MEEDILQRVIQEIKTYGDLDGIEDIRPLGKAIENLIARNKELEGDLQMRNDYIKDLQKKLTNSIEIKSIHQYYILKSKVMELQNKYKKEIEKLESKKIWNESVDTINKNRYTNYYNAYEELLQEGDK